MAKDDPAPGSFDIQKALQQALTCHRANRLHDAERLYQDILKVQAQHPDANHNLGVLAVQMNQPETALRYLKAALEANPNQGQYWLSYIDALIRTGQFDSARQVLQQAHQLGLRGPSVDALAQQLTRQFSTSQREKNSFSSSLFGEKSQKNKSKGKGNDKLIKGKLSRRPGSPPAKEINDLILAYDKGRFTEAEAWARAMTQRYPHFSLGWNVLGSTLAILGRSAEALMSMQKAVTLIPPNAEAHSNLGTIFHSLGRLLEAEDSYRQALSLKPDYAEVCTNLGNVLRALGRLTEAEASFLRALSLKPDYADAHVNLGNVHKDLGQLNKAEASYRKALSLKPDYDEAYSNLLFTMNVNPDHSASEYLAEAQRYGKMLSTRAQPYRDWASLKREVPPLRVGLVSGDFKRHPVGYFLESVLTHFYGDRIELLAYVTQPVEDDLTRRLKTCFAEWKSLVGLRDAEAAQRIHDDGVHILIDVAGHTAKNRLPVFAFKPAPVQVSWLGYFASTGIEQMDYLLADRVGVPIAHQKYFSEHIWYLPETRLCFTTPDIEAPITPLPAQNCRHITFGCFQDMGKLNDAVLSVWGRILNALPGSVLRFQNKALDDVAVCKRLMARLESLGISGGHVVFCGSMPRDAYLAAHAEIDMILDTFPYPGGTTTCEALWMGVPTMTLSGNTLLARQGASLLKAAGLPEWIAASQDEYVAKAVAFARDLPKLARLREGLREQVGRSPLFDAARFAGNLEAALQDMWRCRSEEHFSFGRS